MRPENNAPHNAYSLLDNISMIFEEDYTTQIAFQNNMDNVVSHPFLPSSLISYNFALPPFNPPCVSNKEFLNSSPNYDTATPTELSPSMVISYSTNILANPSLWDSNFTATSLLTPTNFLIVMLCYK